MAFAPLRTRTGPLLGGAALLFALGAWDVAAQTDGGEGLSFGFSQRFEVNDNLGLDVVSRGQTTRSETALSFSYLTETRRDRLSLEANAVYRASDGPSGTTSDLADPRLTLAYARTGATARLTAEASLRQSDIAFLRPLEDLFDDDGVLVLPSDLDDLTGEGTQIDRSLSFRLVLGEGGPVGGTLTASRSELRYRDTTAPDLLDSSRTEAGASLRLGLSPVTDLSVGVSVALRDEDGSDRRETRRITADLSHARPNGDLTFAVAVEDSDGVRRESLRIGRALTLPRGSLSFGIGATREDGGQTNVTGNLSYRQDLPRGRITAGLRREVTTDDDDGTLVTALSLGLDRDLTAVMSVGADFTFVRTEALGAGNDLDTASLGLSLSRSLTADWSATLGYRYQMSDEETVGRGSDNSVFLSLSRSFDFRP